jgi:hypothetical protein
VFVTSQGHAYARFRRALLTNNVRLIDAAARELTQVSLEDALRILVVLAEKGARHVLTPTCSSMRSTLSRRLTRTRFPAGRQAKPRPRDTRRRRAGGSAPREVVEVVGWPSPATPAVRYSYGPVRFTSASVGPQPASDLGVR